MKRLRENAKALHLEIWGGDSEIATHLWRLVIPREVAESTGL